MKLRSDGFGLREMILLMCLLLFFLLMATAYVNSLYSNLEKQAKEVQKSEKYDNDDNENVDEDVDDDSDTDDDNYSGGISVFDRSYYEDKEEEFRSACKKFAVDNNLDVRTILYTFTIDDMVSFGYMDNIYDYVDNSKCNGYSNILDDNGDYKVNSYISCSNYRSAGYR